MALAGRAAALLSLAIFAACSVVPSPVVPGKVIGPVGAPQVAEVLGRPVRAASAAEMQHLILLELTDRYAAEHISNTDSTETILLVDPNFCTNLPYIKR